MKDDLLSKDIVQDNSYKLKRSNGDMFIAAVSNTMFYTMFNNTKRKKYVAYFLSLVLEKDYNEILNNIKFSKSILDKERYHNKGETVDLVVNVGEEYYNIEMNNNKSVEFMERNIDYTGRIYGSRAEIGGRYQYNTIVQININNFNFEGNKEIMSTYQYRNRDSSQS